MCENLSHVKETTEPLQSLTLRTKDKSEVEEMGLDGVKFNDQ